MAGVGGVVAKIARPFTPRATDHQRRASEIRLAQLEAVINLAIADYFTLRRGVDR